MTPFAIALMLLAAVGGQSPARIRIPLAHYATLVRRGEPKPEVAPRVWIESVRVKGSFEGGFELSVSGRSQGTMARTPLLHPSGTNLNTCRGEALLERDENGYVEIVALAPRFTLRCTIERQDREFALTLSRVVDVSATLLDGDVKLEPGEGGSQKLSFTKLRRASARPVSKEAQRERLPATAVGLYRLRVFPDEARFVWRFDIHNPNAEPVAYSISAPEGAHVERVDGVSDHALVSEGARLVVPPGDHEVSLTGTLARSTFEAPVQAAAQFVVVEHHPLVRLSVSTDARAVALKEVDVSPEFRGARAYVLARGQTLSWTKTPIETLPTTRFAIDQLSSRFFVGSGGQSLGETTVELTNEGAAEVSFPMRVAPTYAAVADAPIPLTQDADGQLVVGLSSGRNIIELQHRHALRTSLGFAVGELEVPSLEAPATRGDVELRYSRDWIPLYESFAGERRLASPAFGDAILLFVLALWTFELALRFEFRRRTALPLSALAAAASWCTTLGHWSVVCSLSALSMVFVVPWLRTVEVPLLRWFRWIPSSLLGGVVILTLLGGITLFGNNVRAMFGSSADVLSGEAFPADLRQSNAVAGLDGVAARDGAVGGLPSPAAGASNYAGIGVPTELPMGIRRTILSQELVEASGPTLCRVVLISASLAEAAQVVVFSLLLGFLFLRRGLLARGLRSQLAKVTMRPDHFAGAEQAVR
jgi:hypothetical protein